ncbi:MAG: DMT family transporter [Magnetospirillum sp.]
MIRVALLVALAMLAFAANSVLCRLALANTAIDPASFSLVRLASGAVSLGVIAFLQKKKPSGSWRGALALLGYAVAFSFAYVSLGAGTGALLLFGAVQATMVLAGVLRGEHPMPLQWLGLVLALVGLAVLVAPGVTAPPLLGALLMLGSGVAWGLYSILGRSAGDPVAANAGNFLRAAPLALVPLLGMVLSGNVSTDSRGLALAVASGAVASGMGYALWYAVLPHLSAARAASVQLSVPVITALGAVLFLGEGISLRLTLASLAVLGGIALVIKGQRKLRK